MAFEISAGKKSFSFNFGGELGSCTQSVSEAVNRAVFTSHSHAQSIQTTTGEQSRTGHWPQYSGMRGVGFSKAHTHASKDAHTHTHTHKDTHITRNTHIYVYAQTLKHTHTHRHTSEPRIQYDRMEYGTGSHLKK